MLVYTALSLYAMGVIQKLAVPRWAAERQERRAVRLYPERTSGSEEIRAAGAEAICCGAVRAHAQLFLEKRRAAMVISSLTYNLTNLIYVIGYSVGLALGVYLYTQGQASLGTAYLIVYYVGMLSELLQHIREQAEDLQQASASIQRIDVIFRIQPLVSSPPEASQTARLSLRSLSVAFVNVAFHYDDNENVLNEIQFEIRPGWVLGILGCTGSGKSTLTRLLFRLYDPDHGSIRLGGWIPARRSRTDLRVSEWGWSPRMGSFSMPPSREPDLFQPGNPDARLEEVADRPPAVGLGALLPLGLDTLLASGGQGLSAGRASCWPSAGCF